MTTNVLDILSQQSRSQHDFPYPPNWIVSHISLTPEGAAYGTSAAYPVQVTCKISTGETCHWRIPLPLCWRYDLTNAQYDACPTREFYKQQNT